MSDKSEDDFAKLMRESIERGTNNRAKQIADGINKEVISELRELAEGGHIEIIKRKLKGKFSYEREDIIEIPEELHGEVRDMMLDDLNKSRND